MTIRHVNQRDMKLDFMRALGTFYLTHVFWVISLSAMANSLHIEIISIFWIKFIIVVILTTVTVLVMDKIKICYKRYKRI